MTRMMNGVVVLVLLAATNAQAQYFVPNVDVVFGAAAQPARVPDFKWDQGNRKLKTRSLMLAELGDPSEIGCRRTGPDNAQEGTVPGPVTGIGRVTLCLFYAQALGPNGDYEGQRLNGQPCLGRSAEIALQTDGPQTADSRPGRLVLATTRPGECESRPVFAVNADGQMDWSGQPVYEPGQGGECAWVPVTLEYQGRPIQAFIPIVGCSTGTSAAPRARR